MNTMRSAAIGNTILWVVTILAVGVLGRDSAEPVMLIVIPAVAGAVSIYLVTEAARKS